MFMFKLVLGDKNKIVKLKTDSFQLLKKQIEKSFNNLPIDYCLSYLDEDKDQICLNSDEDMSVLLGIGAKVNKIFIKQSLSQVIQIENTFQIEPTFQVNQSIDEIKDNYVNPNECHKIQITEHSVDTLQLNNKDEKQQVKEQVKLEINIEKQDEPDETEINKGVFKNVFFTKNEEVVDEINVQQKINNQKNDSPAKEQKKELIIQPQINIPQEVTKIQIKQEGIINSAENNQEINKTEIKEDNKINDENQQKKNEQVVINLNVQEKKQQIKQQPIVDIIIPVEQKKIQIQKQLPLKKQIIKNDKIQKDMFKIRDKKPIKPINIQLHYHKVVCSECQDDYGIIGIRYQCILCENYNICQTCEESNVHVHSLAKVKIPSKEIKKEDIIKKYRKQIYGPIEPHYNIPQGNYVPSISKQQALGYIKAAQQTFNEVLQRNKRIMNAMYFKLEMNHKNPYEILKQQKSVIKPNPQTIKDKITYLVNLLAIQQRQASYFCNMYKDVSKERIAEIYLEKMEKR